MSKKGNAAPKVPGAPTPDACSANPEDSNPGSNSGLGDSVTIPKADFDKLMARLDNLESKQAAQPVARRANPNADLPHQDDIDPALIKSPVLTQQGWIVPEKFGSHQKVQK